MPLSKKREYLYLGALLLLPLPALAEQENQMSLVSLGLVLGLLLVLGVFIYCSAIVLWNTFKGLLYVWSTDKSADDAFFELGFRAGQDGTKKMICFSEAYIKGFQEALESERASDEDK